MWATADESRHPDVDCEAWWWWGWDDSATTGLFVGLELRGRRFDYWAGLVRPSSPYLYVEELDGTGLRSDLELKPPEMWAGHTCDVAFGQWSLGNEAHGVLLDDPDDAHERPYGHRVPVTFDIEWYATSDPQPIDGGYAQKGEIDARIELTEGILVLQGPASRVHVWGMAYLPADDVTGSPRARAPYRRHDGTSVDQTLTAEGWSARMRRSGLA